MVTDQACQRAYSVQVKTNAQIRSFWLLNKKAKEQVSESHIYVFVNLTNRKSGDLINFYIVPSTIVARKMWHDPRPNSDWYSFLLTDAEPYKDKWSLFGASV